MDNFNTLPMPEGFGKQVETPQGWRFRHCATFFVGDMCPDCHKTGFLAAAAAINEPAPEVVEIKAPAPNTPTTTPATVQTPDLNTPPADQDTPGNAQEGTKETPDAPPASDVPPPAAEVQDPAPAAAALATTETQLPDSLPPAEGAAPAAGNVPPPAAADAPAPGGKQSKKAPKTV